MKKILDFLADPLKAIAVGGAFFGVGIVDSLLSDASSYGDLHWWGKSAVIGFCIVLGALAVRYFLLPIGYWIAKALKIVK